MGIEPKSFQSALDHCVDRRQLLHRAASAGLSLAAVGAALRLGGADAAYAQATASGAVDLAPIIEAAKKEGGVVVSGNQIQSQEGRRALAEGFRARYGLPASFKIDQVVKSIGVQHKQLEDELTAGKVSTDVIHINYAAWAVSLAKRGKLVAFDAPEYSAYSRWDNRPGFNNRPYYVSDPCYLMSITWNPSVIKGNNFESWFDLLRPEYKGQISCDSARLVAGAALSYKGMRETPEIGNAFFERLAKLEPVTTTLSQIATEKVVSGEFPITLGSANRPFAFWKQGARNIAQSFPKEGVVILPAIWMSPVGSPNPNAAKLMLNFARSQEGQQILADNEGAWSGRSDIRSPNEMFVPNAARTKLIVYDQAAVTEKEMRQLGDDWRNLFGM